MSMSSACCPKCGLRYYVPDGFPADESLARTGRPCSCVPGRLFESDALVAKVDELAVFVQLLVESVPRRNSDPNGFLSNTGMTAMPDALDFEKLLSNPAERARWAAAARLRANPSQGGPRTFCVCPTCGDSWVCGVPEDGADAVSFAYCGPCNTMAVGHPALFGWVQRCLMWSMELRSVVPPRFVPPGPPLRSILLVEEK